MKTLKEIKNILARNKERLRQEYKVRELGIFGSYARGQQNRISDVDILVELEEPIGFGFIHMADFLENLLDVKVDLTTRDAIRPNRWRYIKGDLMYV